MSVLPVGFGSALGGYQIERSLRFNSADSAYLNRTPGSASNRKTWTWSAWVKKSALGGTQALFTATIASPTTDSNLTSFGFNSSDRISIGGGLTTFLETSQVFRDLSAWYHLVCAVDTTQATADNRVRFYVNGSEITAFASRSNPTQNLDTAVNSTVQHNISSGQPWQARYFNGYLTEVNFIDGQALTPSSFGETDSNTGVWKPKAFSGTYGTNGFYLKFADNSGTTSTTLGKDSSGNGNNWTPNNFSVTAGVGNDSLVDSPTSYGTGSAGGDVRGNYSTMNPLDSGSGITLANGNLDITTGTSQTQSRSTFAVSTGKWYAEVTTTIAGGAQTFVVGVSATTATKVYYTDPLSYGYGSFSGNKINNNSDSAYGSSYTTGDIIGIALDMDNGKVWFSKNGTWQASGNPASGTNQAFSGLVGQFVMFCQSNGVSNGPEQWNFGQRAFAYTAPSGFKALCTQNLPTPTIGATSTTQANDYFNVVTYTGNGTAIGSGGLTISSLDFQPDFIWVKSRSAAYSHNLYDAVRGATKKLSSDATTAENVQTEGVTAFNSNGFTVGNLANVNENSQTYVAWNWKANGAGSSNTAGTITSTVSANTTSGFSIATYTGNGTGGATVGHGLGVSPSWIIIKSRSNATNWMVWTDKLTTNYALEGLNTTGAEVSGGSPSKYIRAVSSTTFTIGNDISVNQSASYTYVAYCFAPVAGYSAFGSYTGNGSADGVFVYTGFRPRYLLIKETGNVNSWEVYDTARNEYNVQTQRLFPNDSQAEATTNPSLDILSNGFKCRAGNTGINRSGGTYIYMAIAESPFKYSLGR